MTSASPKEEALTFGSKAKLRGILTHPSGEGTPRAAVLFLNSGLVHHIGPHRLYVKAARDLAERGHLVMRMDFSGIGDSDRRTDNLRFERAAVEDAREGLDYLSEKHGASSFGLAGLCSGAEISFRTALEDERVKGALMINAPQFADEPSGDMIAEVSSGKSAAYYWRVAMFSKDSWKRALSGQAEYSSIVKAIGNKAKKLVGGSSKVQQEANVDLQAFEQLVARDVKLRLLFSEVDWGHEYLQTILGGRIEEWKRGGNPDLRVFSGVDHMMTSLDIQQRAREMICEWADGLPAGG